MVFNDLQFRIDFADWVVDLDLSFRQVTHRRTCDIFAMCLEDSDKIIPKSPSVLSSWIRDKWFGDAGMRAWLKEQLRHANSNIHLSADAWTSEEGTNYLAVAAHFLDEQYSLRTALLDLPPLKSPHSGGNIAKVPSAVIEYYGRAAAIGFFMMDNASSNDTCIRQL